MLLVPTGVSILWFVVFGGTELHLQLNGVDIAGTGSAAAGFFAALQQYPFFIGSALVVMVLTAVFFVRGGRMRALSCSGRRRVAVVRSPGSRW
ncbi:MULTISPECIES: BCCT family transporter [unclassified Cryobacterium]|uniref:BCCT family transporter n=1 Tax=unclassified Cryobacterium TaxID=2649013 RepID=UPI0018E0C258|nr:MULTISPECIES: BCCT family transporter [unclassified Cryobacterium]